MRTVAGVGTWTGWVCSTEMDNAVKYGYKFEIIKGYQFKSSNIFKEYIEELYKFRMEYPKSHPMNYIAKLLMNSLYGKFGMRMETTHRRWEVEIFNISDPLGTESFKEIFELWAESIIDIINIDNYKILVRNTTIAYKYDEKDDIFHGIDINVAIASAITSGSRVHMSIFKNNPNFKLYYSDTDSIFIDKSLPNEYVGNKLGQMKLEYIIKRAVFLAPKVYGIEDINGNSIIKIKGVTVAAGIEGMKLITVDSLEKLLIQNEEIEFKQFKWFKKVLDGNISIHEAIYTATSNNT